MRRRGGRQGKKPEWAMGRTRRGGEFDGCIMHRVPTSYARIAMKIVLKLPKPFITSLVVTLKDNFKT